MTDMDAVDRKLLNLLQEEFPLVEEPYAALGVRLGVEEAEVLRRIETLKKERIIRQLSAIFDTRSLGYRSSLVAASYPAERLDEAAEVINAHPGVSHNYKRNHEFNLWFTLAVPPTSRLGLETSVEKLGELSRADSIRLLPTLKLYKIGVQLDMTGEQSITATSEEAPYGDARRPQKVDLSPEEIGVVRELQRDLPVTPSPFGGYARALGIEVRQILDIAERLQARGQMRRFAAVLHHRQAGFRANAMGVWKVPAERCEEVGATMASFRAVSHCYLRPTYPDWPYNIFTMVHGRHADECEAVLGAIAERTGVSERRALYSSKEYKKTRVPYFTPDYEDWETRHGASPAAVHRPPKAAAPGPSAAS